MKKASKLSVLPNKKQVREFVANLYGADFICHKMPFKSTSYMFLTDSYKQDEVKHIVKHLFNHI